MALATQYQEDHWGFREVNGRESTIYLPSVDTTLALADAYALIEFEIEFGPEIQ